MVEGQNGSRAEEDIVGIGARTARIFTCMLSALAQEVEVGWVGEISVVSSIFLLAQRKFDVEVKGRDETRKKCGLHPR